MLSWPIKAALDSGCFDRIIISTDDDEIAMVAEEAGAEAPFRRSAELADDYTPTVPVIVDTIAQLNLPDLTPVCCLYATSPFVTATDLRSGLECLEETGANFVVSVTTYAFPIQRALRRNQHGEVAMFDTAQMQTRSQDLEEAWHDAGQFYWGKAAKWKTTAGIFGDGSQGLVLPRHRVQDIDTNEDWQRAEQMMRLLQLDSALWT